MKNASIEVAGENAKYIENISFETAMMLPSLSEAVADREIGKVMPPTKTTLGYHIVKLMKILPPSTQPLNQVKLQIENDLLENKKSDHIFDLFTKFENMLDDGISFENIAKKINISLDTVSFIDNKGLSKTGNPELNKFAPEDKDALTEIIFLLEEGSQAIPEELPSGKFISASLESIEKKTYRPLEEVKEEIHEKYISDQKYIENKKIMDKYLAELDVQGSTFESIAKENKKTQRSIKNISIVGNLPEPLKDENRPIIFQTSVGGHQSLRLDGQFALMKISGYNIPEISEGTESSLTVINQRLHTESEEEALLVYLNMLGNKYNATINTNLLKRVYGQEADEN